jgi:hypothetical protein
MTFSITSSRPPGAIASRQKVDHLRLIVQDAAQLPMPAEDRREEMAVRAADVDESREAPEPVPAGDGLVLDARDARHGRGEPLLLVRMGD